jgi:hypothetical protein
MTISLVWVTEAIHPPLDRLSRRQGKRFERFLLIFAVWGRALAGQPVRQLNDK